MSAQESPPSLAGNRPLPPITALCLASMALLISGGIYLAAHLPVVPPLGPAVGLTAASGIVLVVAIVSLARVAGFAWARFFLVARNALLAYAVISGLLAFVFVRDGTRGSALVLLIATLVIFAFDVPLVLAFTVARYHTDAEP